MAFIPVGQRPLAYIDTETTGLLADKHEIVSIAIVFDTDVARAHGIQGLTFPDGEDYGYFYTLIKPQHLEVAEPKALEINGYAAHPELWDDAPIFDAVAGQVVRLLNGAIPIGHNIKFDTGFVQEAIQRAGIKARIDYHAVDTCTLAWATLVPDGLERLSLDSIRDFLGWDKEGAHTALQDALDARRLYKLTVDRINEASHIREQAAVVAKP